MVLVVRECIDNRSHIGITEVNKPVNIHCIGDRRHICVASSDERPVDAIDDRPHVCITPVHKSVIVYSGNDWPHVCIAGMDEAVYIYRCDDWRHIRITSTDETPSLPIAIIRFVVGH